MNISQRLRTCAKHTGLDAVIELLQEAADEIDALQARAQVQGEPFGYIHHFAAHDESGALIDTTWEADGCADPLPHPTFPSMWKWAHCTPFYTTPQPAQATSAPADVVRYSERELELIDGMIAVQLDHAQRCDAISNRAMAEKQKGWDMERVELLHRIRSLGITAQDKKEDE